MKAYTIERWDSDAVEQCVSPRCDEENMGAWVTVLETGDFYEAGRTLEKWKSFGPVRATFNTMRVKIRP